MRFSNLVNIVAATITVTTSGTPVQGADSAVPPDVSILVRAHRNNTGVVTIAGTSADALYTGTDNFELAALEEVALKLNNTNQIWADSSVSGDLVEVIFVQ